LAVSSKKHFRTGIASELRYPAALSTDLKDKLEQFHNNIIEKSGLTYGITHAEYIISDNNFYLVEMACRGGGSLIPSDIVPFVSGVDVYSAFYELQQGKTPQLVPDKRQKHAVLYFFEYPSGLVVDVKGLDIASELPGIHSLELEFKSGDMIKSAGDDRSRQGYTIVFADSEHELEERLQRLINTLEVRINEEGKAA
jgi:carbamoyl-phosphate synthase large subunit